MQSIQLVYGYQQGQETIQDIAGTPSSVCIQGLQSATSYRLQAVLFNDGVELAQSNIASFVTLGASAITLTLHNISRENYNYRVHYLFSSTYTLSSAVLSCNGQTFQGTVSGNTITFIVTGLTAGNAYLYNVTATDIYGFSETANGSITTTVVNQVNLYYSSRTENSVTLNLSYIHDYEFQSGYVDVWLSTQDPQTDQSIDHFHFQDGDTQITCEGLEPETEYIFIATLELIDFGGNLVYVKSNSVTATTAEHDYSRDYFTVNGGGVIKFYKNKSDAKTWEIEYSNDGVNWTRHTIASRSSAQQYLNNITVSGGKTYIRTRSYGLDSDDYVYMDTTYPATVSGNAMSLLYVGSAGSWINKTSFPSGRNFYRLFRNWTNLTDASKLILQATTLPDSAYEDMFRGCTSLVNPPKEIPATAFPKSSASNMFNSCTALTSTPKIEVKSTAQSTQVGFSAVFAGCSSITSAENITLHVGGVYDNLFNSCTSLTTLPKLVGSGYLYCDRMFAVCTSLEKGLDITKITDGVFERMYDGCTSLKEAYAPTLQSWAYTGYWLNNVAASGTLYADQSVAGIIPTDVTWGCPSGWNIDIL